MSDTYFIYQSLPVAELKIRTESDLYVINLILPGEKKKEIGIRITPEQLYNLLEAHVIKNAKR